MSEDHYRNQLERYAKERAKLREKRADELRKAARLGEEIRRISKSLNSSSSKSASSRDQKQRQINDKRKKVAEHEKKAGDYDGQIAQVEGKIATAENNLHRAIESRQQTEAREAKRRRDDELKHHREMKRNQRRTDQAAEQERRRSVQHERTLTGEVRRRADLFSPRVTIEYVQRLPEKLIVLFVAANPRDEVQLKLHEEVRDITERLQRSRYGRAVDLRSIWAVRPGDLMDALSEHEPHVVHFSGHGSDRDEIVFLDKAGNAKTVSKDAITATIATTADHVRLVLFNTCHSRGQAETAAAHIEATIGMRSSVGDEAARVFARDFYSAIGYGYSVKRAFDKARAAVMLEGIHEEDTPELFTRDGIDADELVLVRPDGPIADAA